jgi:hypothetical protein
VFGCACWPNLRPYNPTKLNYQSLQCVFLAYSPMYKGYKCLHIPTNHVYISCDVVFNEDVFPFAIATSPSPPPTADHILLPMLQLPTLPLPHDQCANMTTPSTLHDVSNLPSMSSGDVGFRSQDTGTTTAVAPAASPSHAEPTPDHVTDAPQSSGPMHGDDVANPTLDSSPGLAPLCLHHPQQPSS